MKHIKILAAGPALLLLASCGGGDTPAGQPSAEERRALDNIAAKQDADAAAAETFDTSPDSLIPAEGAAADGNAASGNAATPGAAMPPADTSTHNGAAPR